MFKIPPQSGILNCCLKVFPSSYFSQPDSVVNLCRALLCCGSPGWASWPVDQWTGLFSLWENIPPDVYIHLKSEDTKSIILPPFCATSVLERVKSYLFVENISLDYIRKENESITFVQPNLEGYQDWRRIIEFGSYLHTLFCTGSTSLTKINE